MTFDVTYCQQVSHVIESSRRWFRLFLTESFPQRSRFIGHAIRNHNHYFRRRISGGFLLLRGCQTPSRAPGQTASAKWPFPIIGSRQNHGTNPSNLRWHGCLDCPLGRCRCGWHLHNHRPRGFCRWPAPQIPASPALPAPPPNPAFGNNCSSPGPAPKTLTVAAGNNMIAATHIPSLFSTGGACPTTCHRMNWQFYLAALAVLLAVMLMVFVALRYRAAHQRRIQLNRKLALKRATRNEATFNSPESAEIHESPRR